MREKTITKFINTWLYKYHFSFKNGAHALISSNKTINIRASLKKIVFLTLLLNMYAF